MLANSAAQMAMAGGDALRLDREGRLALTDQVANAALARALSALAEGSGTTFPVHLAEDRVVAASLDPFTVPGRSAGPPFWPSPETRLSLFVLCDAEPAVVALGRRQLTLYGLTPAEQALATAIAAGETPDEIADARGVSRHTIRNQLKSIYTKTGVSRQSQLAALVHRLVV